MAASFFTTLFISLALLALCTAQNVTPYLGVYAASDSSLTSCHNLCRAACCVINTTVETAPPPYTLTATFFLDPAYLATCGATSTKYISLLTLQNVNGGFLTLNGSLISSSLTVNLANTTESATIVWKGCSQFQGLQNLGSGDGSIQSMSVWAAAVAALAALAKL